MYFTTVTPVYYITPYSPFYSNLNLTKKIQTNENPNSDYLKKSLPKISISQFTYIITDLKLNKITQSFSEHQFSK